MLVVGSNRFVLNNNLKEQETLNRMGIEDVEEGEISDSASVEEISEEDFNKQEVRVLREAKPKADTRVWTMRDLQDLYKYHQACSGYTPRLYNLAWAQAVQNKPLNDIFVMDDEESKRSSSSSNTSRDDSSSAKEVAKVIIDDSGDEMDVKMDDVSEKEEGELEEGEIDLDSEPDVKDEGGVLDVNEPEIDLKERELVERVKSIQEDLESVTVIEAEKSFSGVCSRLQNTLGSLQKVVGESSVPTKDALAQQLINAFRALNYVFCSMNSNQKELNKDVFSRLLSCVECGDSPIFSIEHIKEVEVMMSFLDTPAAQSSAEASDKVNDVQVTDGMNRNILDSSVESAGRAFASAKKLSLDSISVESYNQNNPDALKPGLSSKLVTAKVAHETQDSIMHPYETDALKAVSTYQQKFGLTSFLPIDKLPSPTPSEESGDTYGDISGEVSSSSTISAPITANAPALGHPIVSSAPQMDSSIVQGPTVGRNTSLVSSGPHLDSSVVQGLVGPRNTGAVNSRSNSILRASAKSRDPRLRLASSDAGSLDLNERPLPAVSNSPKVDPLGEIVSSRKQKSAEEPLLDGPVTKRQRNGLTSPATVRDAQTVVASGGWLEDSNTVIPPIMNRNQLIENTGTDPKEIGKWSNRSLVTLQKIQCFLRPSNSILGVVPPASVAPLKPSALGQKPAGALQVPQTGPMNPQDESGKVRMKPRDPRRILHANSFQRSGSSGSEQFKTNAQKQEDQQRRTSSMTPTFPQILSSQSVQVNTDRMDVKATVSDSGDQLTANGSKPESAAAAIQRERARRIDEQKKMFSARKLCLVLDLDHTLLNSAKFVEVDPVHDEILRKKEEQDREKSQRHLFRFPHMGMWTKLRPGIWNFLEKASKLYELHLYTMGNKLYATEMAKVLDPKGVLFAGRVISKGDDGDVLDGDERVPKSKDLEGVLGMESAVVIIDDSVRVWPHNKLNLIVVERYTYFPCSRRQFGLPGPSLLEIDHDERPEDGTLASSLAVIERIHQSFFSNRALDEVDVRNILASEQRKILAGCRIVFSRVFPVGEANPHLHPLWQTAESFGAVCTNQIDEQVTHVVANSLGTDKVNWALSTGRFVVHPGWVEASALLYRRANEQDFAIKP
ncbi:RNA polymerase II C-terminal domain phosphatase-like 3 [Vitis vinifera]|uniref:protein-serine/threonine phosphatase n=1 Tax=Vitis vinifera TaxID=29760 RepID=A0A438H159_VITVI|nr:RNA polymerase II C-terminal domain phosphatase-like 3 [Vitis vinifera]